MHCRIVSYVYAICILLSSSRSVKSTNVLNFYQIIDTFTECFRESPVSSCLVSKAARTVDRTIDLDVSLFDGFVLKRNERILKNITQTQSTNGLSHLTTALSKFLDTHTLTLDLSESRKDSAMSSFGKVNKKDKKYLYYALLAVAGIFGLSGPLLLKGLALLAGQALLASKAALIIVGSVALKKIFQSDKDSSPVKVHTHTVPLDDHDRQFNTAGYPYVNY